MSDETVEPTKDWRAAQAHLNEEDKIAPRPELKRLPEWFQQQYGPGGRVLPALEDVIFEKQSTRSREEVDPDTGETTVTVITKSKLKYASRDPRQVGPAAQQEKKPL